MNIPENDLEMWRTKFATDRPSVVLRQIAIAYNVSRSDLGPMFTDIFEDANVDAVKIIWSWDFRGAGRGLSDAELDEGLLQLMG